MVDVEGGNFSFLEVMELIADVRGAEVRNSSSSGRGKVGFAEVW